MSYLIRLATPADAVQIAAIYAPIVAETHISFEEAPPPPAEMARRIAAITAHYPWLVCEREGCLLGYVYAHRYRERAAYQWTAEVSAYMRADSRGRGLGKVMYAVLFDLLRLQGFYKVIAGVALPNPASIGLHEAMGFCLVGTFHKVGYKAGAWRDVSRWEMPLGEAVPEPAAPRPPAELLETPAWREAIARGERILNEREAAG